METGLTPREIQAQVRAGASVAEVAEATEMAPERVEAFAAPVLAEREHIALQARKASLRRQNTSIGYQTLDDAVAARLQQTGTEPDAAVWDSFKMDDGRWAVTIEYDHRQAVFHYDARGRFAIAADDEGRRITGEEDARGFPSGGSGDDEPTVRLVAAEDELALIRAVETDEDAEEEPSDASVSPESVGLDPAPGSGPSTSSGREEPASSGREEPASSGREGPSTGSGRGGPSTSSGREDPSTSSGRGGPSTSSGREGPSTSSGREGPSTSSGREGPSTSSGREDPSTGSGPVESAGSGRGESSNNQPQQTQLELLYDMLGGEASAPSTGPNGDDTAATGGGVSDAAAVPEAPVTSGLVDETWAPATDYPAEPEPEPEQPDLLSAAAEAESPSAESDTGTPSETASGSDAAPTAGQAEPNLEAVADTGDAAEDTATGATEDTAQTATAGSTEQTEETATAGATESTGPDTEDTSQATESTGQDAATTGAGEQDEQATQPAKPKSKKRKRAAVPSWDEIMFGAPKKDE